jgi:hypothetical protein
VKLKILTPMKLANHWISNFDYGKSECPWTTKTNGVNQRVG